ncbi:hypothetical protein LSH36_177g01038 [Paralvinella palmiformis]|uniref:BZIP domain-containing protein n=1 Tax=Paralvinella palmiformis TaxID=53620 RepID=A0AAD9N5S1_9ANNE|nr:hypothetical protein LSH36_177g01038 [Paralvinella palmiformis]
MILQLTPEEIAKKERRRAQNRRAAQRCREKKKQEADHVTMAFKKLQSANTGLRHEIKKLQSEKQKLSNVLQSHLMMCQKGDKSDAVIPSTSSISSSLSSSPTASSSQMAEIVVMETSTEDSSEADDTSDE